MVYAARFLRYNGHVETSRCMDRVLRGRIFGSNRRKRPHKALYASEGGLGESGGSERNVPALTIPDKICPF